MSIAKGLRVIGLAVAVAGALVGAGLYFFLRRPLPKTRGSLRLKDLESPVEVIRDRWGVPHIYASNQRDLFYVVGYVQAQDRLWQMEFNRRLATGTLSEVVGPHALEFDRLLRRIGFQRAAERDWQDLEERRDLLEAFSAGVNAYLQAGPLPVEFTILRYRPKPWRPTDTLAFARFMAWTLAGNWDEEILRSWTVAQFGAEAMAELEPGYPPGKPLSVPPGAEARGPSPSLNEDYQQAANLVAARGGMSNSWAVDGSKSVSGKPLLANDPHLVLTMPSTWYEMHLESPEVRATGVTLPGTPVIIIGHNDRIAWGVTAALADGDDLYVERVNPDDPSQYEYRGQWEQGQVVREEIRVRGKQPLTEEVLITRQGPIISPCIRGEGRLLALRTVGLERAHQFQGYWKMMTARNWEEFREAASEWALAAINFVYADAEGNIGNQMAGLVPIRAKGHGVVPAPGWSDKYEWTGFVAFEELPSAYNPPTHWVANANNKVVDDDYPYFFGANFADSPRMERIVQLLEAKEKLSVGEFKAMQGDLYSIPGRELARYLLALAPSDGASQRAQTFVKAWDYELAPDSVAATIVQAFFVHLVGRAVREKVGSLADFYLGRGVHPLREGGHFFYNAASWLLGKVRGQPDWFAGKGWPEVMEEALAEAVVELRQLLGQDMSHWHWGKLHSQSFQHPLGQIRPLTPIFNRRPVPVGGDANTLWQAAYAPYHGYGLNGWTASWRQIIDLADFNKSLAILPSGQSGHPGSRHYADMVELWRRGEYHPMPWDRPEVERYAEARLRLVPGSGNNDGAKKDRS